VKCNIAASQGLARKFIAADSADKYTSKSEQRMTKAHELVIRVYSLEFAANENNQSGKI
jgi:hypothetical protein